MSLLNPSMGDVLDRLTILSLKRLHGAAAGRDTTHFQREWAGLLAKVQGRTLNGAWFEHFIDLGAVNARLWALTDAMRAFVTEYPEPSELYDWTDEGQLGRAILRANDERARLIRTIDELCGDFTGPEKLA